MTEFHKFAALVHDQFSTMSDNELFVVDVGEVDIVKLYLDSFPTGTNPIYRERTEHDCSCCKQFIRKIGNVVAIGTGGIVTVWDNIEDAEPPYDVVSASLAQFVKSCPVMNVFRAREHGYGAEHTIELLDGNATHKWHHFHGQVAERFRTDDVAETRGKFAATAQVFRRGLEELSLDALTDVRDLIQNVSLYRGEEHMSAVASFITMKTKYDKLTNDYNRNLFVWMWINDRNARFRNTVIGTLVQDLSEGVDLERAVKSFETKVAPQNYKRPTSLITPRMVEQAMDTIHSLSLEPALKRRFARISDVSVNDVLFVDNSVQGEMKGGVESLLMAETVMTTANTTPAEQISIDDFILDVIPQTRSVEMMLKNSHAGNFVSLTAPIHKVVQPLFKWSNNFAWSYDGNVTDSIRERVKRAGGNVDATLRVSLAWFNYDDLDIHVIEPSGNEIYFSNPCGKLDVDMNISPDCRDAVENIQWTGDIPDGAYKVNVCNYTKRESIDVGFVLEVEFNGKVYTFSHEKGVKNRDTIWSLELIVKNNQLTDIIPNSPVVSGSSSIEKWGVHTEQFVRVDSIMFSPNYWEGCASGNKHWFFILKDCLNPDPTRGIYNEFLTSDLEKHRKVFEILGEKTKCEVTDDQLSGVGFSSTKRETVIVLADKRPYEIQF